MKIVIIGQEEPVYFSPFLRKFIEAKKKEISLVVISGGRSSGSHPKTFLKKLLNLYILYLIFEPWGFLRNLLIKFYQKLITILGLTGKKIDKRSIEGAALRYKIPILFTKDINSKEFISKLKKFSPDIIINQSELLLKKEILSVPKIGIINRHASLLPNFRGRLASFWSHAKQPPEYGLTIHFADKEIDSGPIIIQKKFNINSCFSYSKVLDILFKDASNLTIEALDKIKDPNFTPFVNNYKGTKIYFFPSLKEVKAYRKILKKRRK